MSNRRVLAESLLLGQAPSLRLLRPRRRGAAVLARNDNQVADIIARLLADRDALARMAERSRELYRPGAQNIAQAVREMLGR